MCRSSWASRACPSSPCRPIPGRGDEDRALAYLRDLTMEGARQRYGSPVPTMCRALDYELGVIGNMGFAAYFLVVWDLIRFARDSGIRVGPGRGSAAGCCVAYCLRIVDLDPIRYDLLFERFLNPGRKQMPDIDMDFDERYRSDVMRYAAEKYGSDRVAQVVTFSTIKARAAVRDAARVLGKPYIVGDRIAKAMPPLVMGRDTPLQGVPDQDGGSRGGLRRRRRAAGMYEPTPTPRRPSTSPGASRGCGARTGSTPRRWSSPRSADRVPAPSSANPTPGGKPEDVPIVTQYEMHGVEELGLLKMDFLGLRNLSIIETDAGPGRGEEWERPDIDSVDLADGPPSRCCAGASRSACSSWRRRCARPCGRWRPPALTTWRRSGAIYRPGPMAVNMHRDYPELKNGRRS